MKIAFLVIKFPVISETFILNQIIGLINRGHEVYIFADTKKKESKIHREIEKYNLLDKTIYFNIPRNRFNRLIKSFLLIINYLPKYPKLVLKSLNFLKYEKNCFTLLFRTTKFIGKDFDILHCQFGPMGVIGCILKKMGLIDAKIITSFRGYDMSQSAFNKYKKEYPLVFKESTFILPVCDFFKKILVKKMSKEDKILVHHSGTDTSMLSCKEYDNSRNGEINIITIGRLKKKKGIEFSIRAVAKIIKQNPEIKINYSIVGEGELKNKLKHLALKLGIDENVSFLGLRSQREIIRLLHSSSFLLSSNVSHKEDGYDGIPGVIREAMACCLPVIATKSGGIPEAVLDKKSGFLVSEKDVDDLTEKIQYLIDHRDMWREMGHIGRQHIKEHFDINKLNDKLEEIYKKCFQ